MQRQWKNVNISNFRYMIVALLFICFIYYAYIFHFLQEEYYKRVASVQFKLIVFHIAFILMMWSFIRSVLTDPGRVPVYWGLFLDDPESKKRRYCLICHVFKPERCHHCSTCLRCVLNMDHHCPWINNCVGFNNRKFFMLMLLYVCFVSIFCLLTMAPILIDNIITIIENPKVISKSDFIFKLCSFLSLCIFCPVISHFFHFHIKLVLFNNTTIEQLEKAREKQDKTNVGNNLSALDNFDNSSNVYDIGKQKNFLQVFGQNPILWLLPIYGESGKPNGDGVVWNKNTFQRSITLETKDPNDQAKAQQSKGQLNNEYKDHQILNQFISYNFYLNTSVKDMVKEMNSGDQTNQNEQNHNVHNTLNNNSSFPNEYQSSLVIQLLNNNNNQSQNNLNNNKLALTNNSLPNLSPRQQYIPGYIQQASLKN